MQAGVWAFQKRFVQAAVWIWKGVRVKSSIGEFRVRSSQGSCNCTCRGSAGTIPRAQSLRDTRMPPHIGIKDRRWFGEGAEPGPRHRDTKAVYRGYTQFAWMQAARWQHSSGTCCSFSLRSLYIRLHNDASCIKTARGDETALLMKRFACLCSKAQSHNQFAALTSPLLARICNQIITSSVNYTH